MVRVHPELLAGGKIPPALIGDDVWAERLEDIRAYERFLTRNGTAIRKFFLNVSKDEQRRRFMKRLRRPDKHWKFDASDVAERRHWDAYQGAYDEAIRGTAAPHAPWLIVPADHKWYARLVVAAAIVDAVAEIGADYPPVDAAKREELKRARAELEKEG